MARALASDGGIVHQLELLLKQSLTVFDGASRLLARSRHGSDTTLWCHSLPCRSFAALYTREPYSALGKCAKKTYFLEEQAPPLRGIRDVSTKSVGTGVLDGPQIELTKYGQIA